MSIARQKRRSALNSWDEVKRSWMNFGKDLMAFASLQLAWFIVWRALRHGRRKITEQPDVSEHVTGNSAWAGDGKISDSNQRNTEHERSVADSIGHGHHYGLSLDNGEA
jgi:hypothetical protein